MGVIYPIVRFGILLFAFLALSIFPLSAEINYSKTADLPALRISFGQLQSVLDKAASLIRSANGPTSPIREELELQSGELKVAISGYRINAGDIKLPEYIDRFQFTAFTTESKPITKLYFTFSDFQRSITVAGQSPDQVDAVFSTLRDDLLKISSSIGGSVLRSFLFSIIIPVLATLIIFLTISYISQHHRILVIPILFAAGALVTLFTLPISELLAGFSAYRGEASFIVRYAPQISLIGLITTVIAGLLSVIPLIFRQRGNNETPGIDPPRSRE